MTIIKLPGHQLWIHSPIQLTPDLFQLIKNLGQVVHLVSPSAIHYASIPQWQAAFPQAKAWASPGVRQRARQQKIDVTFDDDLTESPAEEWADDISQHIFAGSRVIQEVVFFHHQSRALILTNLIEIFNPDKVHSRFWRSIHRLAKTQAPFGSTPIDYRASFFGNKELARHSLSVLQKWPIENIIVAHGDNFIGNGAQELERAFSWLSE